jgi:uncharacterized protein
MATITAEEVISSLQLEPLAYEGGFYRRLHLSPDMCDTTGLGEHGKSTLPLSSVIYYVVTVDSFSALHWLAGEEVWTFILGDPLEQLVLFPDGLGELRFLGNAIVANGEPVSVVPSGCWQGTRLLNGDGPFGFALCSTVMSPAYDESDFRLAERSLIEHYPAFSYDIQRFMR